MVVAVADAMPQDSLDGVAQMLRVLQGRKPQPRTEERCHICSQSHFPRTDPQDVRYNGTAGAQVVDKPRRGAASHRLAAAQRLTMLSLMALCRLAAGVVTEPGERPDTPLPVLKEAFEWATAVGIRLNDQGIPMSIEEGDSDDMLSACVRELQQHLQRIPRTSGVVELFSGSARIARTAATWCQTWSFEKLEFQWQDAPSPRAHHSLAQFTDFARLCVESQLAAH